MLAGIPRYSLQLTPAKHISVMILMQFLTGMTTASTFTVSIQTTSPSIMAQTYYTDSQHTR